MPLRQAAKADGGMGGLLRGLQARQGRVIQTIAFLPEPALFTYGCLGARLVGIHPDIQFRSRRVRYSQSSVR